MTRARSRGPDRDPDTGLRLVPGGAAQHPSYLALDRAALGSRTAELDRHLAECERCRAHIERVSEPVAVPSAAVLERHARRAPMRRPSARRGWLGGLAAAAAAAVLLVAVLTGREGARPARPADRVASEVGFDTAKGGRAVGVYVLRGRHTFLWNGTEPVAPGDSIRLKLVPDGMTQAHVFSLSRASELVLLHRARIVPDRDALLDAAWKVDGVGEREVLIVVLSADPLSLARAQAAAREGGMGEDVWVARLTLPKRPSTEEVPR
jgi:hypothetical protein